MVAMAGGGGEKLGGGRGKLVAQALALAQGKVEAVEATRATSQAVQTGWLGR